MELRKVPFGIIPFNMLHLKTVNNEITKRGIDAKLVKGNGYYYFIGPAVDGAFSTSVCVYRLNQLPLEQWLFILDEIIKSKI